MKRLAYLAVTLIVMVFIFGVIGFVLEYEIPFPESASNIIPTSTPEPAPTLAPTPSPGSVPATGTIPESNGAPGTGSVPEPTLAPVSLDGVSVYYGKQPPYVRSDCSTCQPDDWIQLTNNTNADDPTWEELVSFLISDATDETLYVPGVYVCGAFAEDLHNNAEAAGIRAAWVALDFDGNSDGHAVNAFNTADRGLVYIDSTGEKLGEVSVNNGAESWDKVAYIAMGEDYGLVSLDVAYYPGYGFYEDYKNTKLEYADALDSYNQRVSAYNADVEEYENWIDGRVFIVGTPEADRVQEWLDELLAEQETLDMLAEALDEQKNDLGVLWEPMGTVSNVEIYW